jgi:hypothetical protein
MSERRDPRTADGEAIRLRLRAVRLVVIGATAAVLGMTSSQVVAAPRSALRATAAQRGIAPAHVREAAARAAAPLLEDAVASRVLTERQGRSILVSITRRGPL